jgi:hypothetical protein
MTSNQGLAPDHHDSRAGRQSRKSSWQARRGSNPQPPVLETGALPIELLACGRSANLRIYDRALDDVFGESITQIINRQFIPSIEDLFGASITQ